MSARNATPVISPDRQQTPQNDNNAIEQEAEEEGKAAAVLKNPSYMDREGPPLDDCCPICFGTFDVPCKANCGHWYCGSCILQYWKYSGPSSRCKCPMCSSRISNLTPEASLHGQQEQEVVKVLEDVRRYNHVFVGGVRGLARKVHVVPFLFKRMLEEMMDPDGHNFFLYEKLMRMFAIFLAILYISSPFDFIPLGRIGVVRLFEYMSMLLAVTLRLAGIFRRRRLNQRVRDLAAAPLEHIPSSRLQVPCETSMEGESHYVSRERKERLSKTRSNPSVAYKNHSSPSAGRIPPLLGSISCPCSIRLIPRREGGRLILEAVPCLPYVKAEKNDGGQALEAFPSFPCIQAQKNDGRLRLYMPRSSPNNSYDNDEQEASGCCQYLERLLKLTMVFNNMTSELLTEVDLTDPYLPHPHKIEEEEEEEEAETFMGPPSKNVRTISQEAFDELVKENIEDLGLDPTEALEDAIQTLTLQGVDLSGIVTCVPGEGSVMENPVIKCLERLKELGFDDDDLDEMVGLLDELVGLFTGVEGSGNVAIGVRNGGLELVCSICSNIPIVSEKVLVSALKTLALLIHDVQSTEMFRSSDGPKMVVGILKDGSESLEVMNAGFAVVAAAATGNEVVKELFIELKIDELILEVLNKQSKGISQGLYDSIRVLLTPDDNRVVASQVYGYARRFAKIGIAIALVESLRSGLTSPSLVSASIALKAVAVNDEICKSIAESGGIDVIFKCIDDSGEHGNKIVTRACCSLLSKLAGSDSNKSAIVEKEGMNKLIQLAARFSDDPSVLQEVMSIFTVLCLRSPDNAARAMEAGAGDLAIQAMEKFSNVQQLQRSSCLMIRNLVARNPENRQVFFSTLSFCLVAYHQAGFKFFFFFHFLPLYRTLLLSHGIEKIIRRAKVNHETCKDAATDALRDLGLDNYNS
ncbi:armadillo repeat-containing protein 6-like [Populus alba x Populus x berolinensis]|uniref:Armadillo repeat-containing protein 6-like n=1 Tax=Populus alba x Populus x berolinensis TaxID=444605 RepID=A0AAD6R2G8_9ROSI|nr:armadillo repeat-containing protein 6-like [Populus alba x Populus x berolinensis]